MLQEVVWLPLLWCLWHLSKSDPDQKHVFISSSSHYLLYISPIGRSATSLQAGYEHCMHLFLKPLIQEQSCDFISTGISIVSHVSFLSPGILLLNTAPKLCNKIIGLTLKHFPSCLTIAWVLFCKWNMSTFHNSLAVCDKWVLQPGDFLNSELNVA